MNLPNITDTIFRRSAIKTLLLLGVFLRRGIWGVVLVVVLFI